MKSGRCGNGTAFLFIIGCILEGCAYVDPYVSVQDSRHDVVISRQLPQVSEAVQYLDAKIGEVERKSHDTGRLHRSLDLLTFGLTTGAAIAPMYKAHRDLVVGLAMGAATSYAGTTLFVPATSSDIYSAGVKALNCLRGRADVFSGAVSQSVGDDGTSRFARNYEALACVSPDKVDAVSTAYGRLTDLADRAVRSDALVAARLRQSAAGILTAMNAQLDSNAPSPAAVFAAGKALTTGIAPGQTSPEKAATRLQAFELTCSDAQRQNADAIADEAVKTFRRVADTLNTALDNVDAVESACPLNVTQASELTLDKDSVTVSANSEIYVRVSGGRPPYRSVWASDPASNGISRSDVPEFVIVKGGSKIAADGTYTLTILDSASASHSKTLTVSAKKSGS